MSESKKQMNARKLKQNMKSLHVKSLTKSAPKVSKFNRYLKMSYEYVLDKQNKHLHDVYKLVEKYPDTDSENRFEEIVFNSDNNTVTVLCQHQFEPITISTDLYKKPVERSLLGYQKLKSPLGGYQKLTDEQCSNILEFVKQYYNEKNGMCSLKKLRKETSKSLGYNVNKNIVYNALVENKLVLKK